MLTPVQKRDIWSKALKSANRRHKLKKNGTDTPTGAYNRALKEAGLKRGSFPDQLGDSCRDYGVFISPEIGEAFEEYDEALRIAEKRP